MSHFTSRRETKWKLSGHPSRKIWRGSGAEAVGVYKEPWMLITHFERYQHFNVILLHDLAFEI